MKVPKPQKPINSSKDDATWRSFTEAEHEEIRKQKAAEPKPEPPPGLAPEIKEAGLAEYVKLYTAPFRFAMGTVFDANDNMVLQIRGWGHIQYSEAKNVTPEQIQDSAGELMCDLLNEWFGRDKRSLEKRLIDEGLIEDR